MGFSRAGIIKSVTTNPEEELDVFSWKYKQQAFRRLEQVCLHQLESKTKGLTRFYYRDFNFKVMEIDQIEKWIVYFEITCRLYYSAVKTRSILQVVPREYCWHNFSSKVLVKRVQAPEFRRVPLREIHYYLRHLWDLRDLKHR